MEITALHVKPGKCRNRTVGADTPCMLPKTAEHGGRRDPHAELLQQQSGRERCILSRDRLLNGEIKAVCVRHDIQGTVPTKAAVMQQTADADHVCRRTVVKGIQCPCGSTLAGRYGLGGFCLRRCLRYGCGLHMYRVPFFDCNMGILYYNPKRQKWKPSISGNRQTGAIRTCNTAEAVFRRVQIHNPSSAEARPIHRCSWEASLRGVPPSPHDPDGAGRYR